jgi:hypothetical protein
LGASPFSFSRKKDLLLEGLSSFNKMLSWLKNYIAVIHAGGPKGRL